MSTEAQIAANQANAQHSTGPQSAAGKAASSQNRRLHGLALSGLRVIRPEERVSACSHPNAGHWPTTQYQSEFS